MNSLRKHLKLICFLSLIFIVQSSQAASSIPNFRLHLVNEPTSIAPWDQKNSNGLYLLSQVFGTLLQYKDEKLVGSLAEKCEFTTKTQVTCQLRETRFSNQEKVQAKDFKESFLNFISPERHAFRADLLFSVKNAQKYFQGLVPRESVGISTPTSTSLRFDLEKADPEFLYNLTSPLLSPLPNIDKIGPQNIKELVTSGAYLFKEWLPGQKMILSQRANPQINLEFLFVSEDSVALNLYEKGELSFLRRLPTLFIEKYRSRSDFFERNQDRFDYIAFAPQLRGRPKLREALARSLDFSEIDQILKIKGHFGCPGLSPELFDKVPCTIFDLKRAQDSLKSETKKIPLLFAYSKQGGEDLKRQAEWIQGQWKKNLKLDISLEQVENKIFIERLKKSPYPIFRKGVSPERPTCLSALEFFTDASSENFIQIQDTEFQQKISQLKLLVEKKKATKVACREAVEYLIENHFLIPTGPIHFSLLVRPEWKNWSLNSLNQLDLSNLSFQPSVSK